MGIESNLKWTPLYCVNCSHRNEVSCIAGWVADYYFISISVNLFKRVIFFRKTKKAPRKKQSQINFSTIRNVGNFNFPLVNYYQSSFSLKHIHKFKTHTKMLSQSFKIYANHLAKCFFSFSLHSHLLGNDVDFLYILQTASPKERFQTNSIEWRKQNSSLQDWMNSSSLCLAFDSFISDIFPTSKIITLTFGFTVLLSK